MIKRHFKLNRLTAKLDPEQLEFTYFVIMAFFCAIGAFSAGVLLLLSPTKSGLNLQVSVVLFLCRWSLLLFYLFFYPYHCLPFGYMNVVV